MTCLRQLAATGLCLLVFWASNSASAGVTDLLLVVGNSGALTSGESARKSGFESYGYTVTVIDDGASQATFNTMAAANNVAWVSPDVSSFTLGTKLKFVTIGVVNEEIQLADEFGFCTSSSTTTSRNNLIIQNNTHYITYGLATGSLTILTSNQSLAQRTGTLASGAVNLASAGPSWDDYPSLLAMEVGASLSGGGNAAGRRVLLPTGSSTFNLTALNSSGQALFLRSLEWAARPNPSLGTILLPVKSTSSLTTQETLRRMQIDVWGWDVSLIDDDASQASYTAAFAGKSAVFLSEEILTTSIGTKLTNCPIGVVNEDRSMSDEFAISSNNASVYATAVTIADNSHYITSTLSTGALTIFSSSQEAATMTGTFAPGLRTLGTVSGAKALAVMEAGGILTNASAAAGRRVQLPWGGVSFDFNALNSNGRTIMRRSIEWAAAPVGTRVLMVVNDADSLSTQERARFTLLESWGFSLNIVDDDATQATFNLATAANTVAYVTEEVLSTALGTKLRSAAIGVVNEEAFAVGNFGLATSQTTTTQSSLTVADGTHYITRTLGSGSFTLFTSSQPVTTLAGSNASGLKVIGRWGSAASLATLEAGNPLTDGSSAAGRRVQLPWGDSGFDINTLNANGQAILRRSLEWAAGLIGYWRLDETSGTLANDSSPYRHHGTAGGSLNFSTATTTPAKLNSGANFNGSTNYIAVTSTATLQPTTALSITAWIKGDTWDSGTYVNTIIRKGDDNPNNYQLAINGGRLEALLNGNDGSGFKGNTTLQGGQWYHVAMTWDGNTVRLYVDGVLDNNPPPTRSSPIGSDSRPLYIGGRAGSTDCFDGVLDEVRLYNYALSATEIEALRGVTPLGVRILKWREIK